jgi:2-keto-4-pentenoate hydratase/2-oxohepta-3-ene-1,7-dioic acid hydratase in catechol pathway
MKLCRFKNQDRIQIGIVEGDEIWVCDEQLRKTEELWYFDEVELLAPASPSKVVCVGRNYAEHAKELGNEVPKAPLLFLKAPSAIIAHGDEIVIPEQSSQVEHEGELAVVIGRDAKALTAEEDPLKYVLGYTCLNDVTARDIQRADVQFTRGKSFDTFCPIGPYLETELDVSDLELTVKVNYEVKQRGRTSQMIFPVPFLIRYISRQMTLKAGDVIATGTPAGVSKLSAGDICEVEIEGIGTLSNHIVSHDQVHISAAN